MLNKKLKTIETQLRLVFRPSSKSTLPEYPRRLIVRRNRLFPASPCADLRRAIHAYMSLANEFHDEHFAWDKDQGEAVLSPIAERLLACLHYYEELANTQQDSGEPYWDSHIYIESATVKIFGETLAQTTRSLNLYRDGDRSPLLRSSFSDDQIEQLQQSLVTALDLINTQDARAQNKRLYDEMFKTRQSILTFLDAVKDSAPHCVVIPLSFVFDDEMRAVHAAFNIPGKPLPQQESFPASYLSHLQYVSAFLQKLSKELDIHMAGHLTKVTGYQESHPKCITFLFLSSLTDDDMGRTKFIIQAAWADHLLGTSKEWRNKWYTRGLTIHARQSIHVGKTPQRSDLKQLLEIVFIDDLKYQRLNLPKRRRSWTKSESAG